MLIAFYCFLFLLAALSGVILDLSSQCFLRNNMYEYSILRAITLQTDKGDEDTLRKVHRQPCDSSC